MTQPAAVAVPVSARAIVSELQRLNISHVINVPDTHQRTVLSELSRQSRIALVTACTEDEAIALNAGLYVGVQRGAAACARCTWTGVHLRPNRAGRWVHGPFVGRYAP